MSAIGESSSSNVSTGLKETALRRKLQVELKEIEKILHQTPLTDPLTDAFMRWHKDFLLAVRKEDDVESVERHFISEAQRMLVDAIYDVPLDNEALLGSDGRAYSRKSLVVYFFKHPPESICRSPLEPENSPPFTTSPHFPARRLAEWLKKQNALPQPELFFEEAYREAISHGEKPLPCEEPQPVQRLSSQAFRDTAESRKLISDLLQIQDALTASNLQDETTQQLRLWQQRFLSALQLNLNRVYVEAEFILLLQEILTDSVSGAPLDELAYLGSDGNTYGSMSLSLFQHSAPEEYKHRSPLDLQNPAPFTVEPHPLARSLLQWLKNRGALLRSESIEQAYQELMQQGAAPPPPTKRNERIRRLKAKQAQRDLAKNNKLLAEREAFDLEIQRIREQTAQIVRENFAAIDQRGEETTQQQLEQIDAQMQRDQEQLRLLRQAIKLEDERAKTLDLRTLRLQHRLEEAQKVVEQNKSINLKIRIAINETKQAINKMNAKRKTKVLDVVICIAGCAFGTWALQSALTTIGSSMGISLAPLRGGALLALSTSRKPMGPSHRDLDPSKPSGLSRGNHF